MCIDNPVLRIVVACHPVILTISSIHFITFAVCQSLKPGRAEAWNGGGSRAEAIANSKWEKKKRLQIAWIGGELGRSSLSWVMKLNWLYCLDLVPITRWWTGDLHHVIIFQISDKHNNGGDSVSKDDHRISGVLPDKNTRYRPALFPISWWSTCQCSIHRDVVVQI